MSHNKERAEKVCLNCGADLIGRYCHACGQENLEPKESLWHLITHYAYDITHFDGKFFSTLKYLLIRPGYLPAEYLKGKRASYLHPIRMYVFTSAFFFIIIFSMFHLENIGEGKAHVRSSDTAKITKADLRTRALKNAKSRNDSIAIVEGINLLGDNPAVVSLDDDSSSRRAGGINFGIPKADYKTVAAYDSAQNALPPANRDGWFTHRIRRRNIEIWNKYDGDVQAIAGAWLKKFVHTIPQLLFLSLPLFSFVLWILYIRWKNKYFYTGHIIFSLYLYIFYFIAYLVFFLLKEMQDTTGWFIWSWIEIALWLYMFYYMYKAMRNFYRQGRGKTFAKLVLLTFASFFIILFLFVIFSVFSAFTV